MDNLIYFGTNRNHRKRRGEDDFGSNFSEDGLANLRFGRAHVGETGDSIDLELMPERIRVDQDRRRIDEGRSRFGSLKLFDEVRQDMKNNHRDTVIFVHGYNVSFYQALVSARDVKRNFAEFIHPEQMRDATENDNVEPKRGLNLVLFSWPSDGSMMPFAAYASDRQDAAASGPAFARGFLKLADFLRGATPQETCAQRVHLIVHSMGTFVLRHALQEIVSQSPGRPPRLFDQIFLMASDEDDDAFEHDHKLKFLPRIAKRVSVYFNNGDKAMAISDRTKGNPDRLGDDGPRLPRSIPGKVSLIDCSNVVSGEVSGVSEHSYFRTEPRVINDMNRVLAGHPSSSQEAFPNRLYDPENNRYRLT